MMDLILWFVSILKWCYNNQLERGKNRVMSKLKKNLKGRIRTHHQDDETSAAPNKHLYRHIIIKPW